MSFVENFRTEQGIILQNKNGQYFFVCSKCNLEFVSLESFLTHQKNMHNESPIVINDCLLVSTASNPKPNPKKEAVVSAKSIGSTQSQIPKPKRTILLPPTKKSEKRFG